MHFFVLSHFSFDIAVERFIRESVEQFDLFGLFCGSCDCTCSDQRTCSKYCSKNQCSGSFFHCRTSFVLSFWHTRWNAFLHFTYVHPISKASCHFQYPFHRLQKLFPKPKDPSLRQLPAANTAAWYRLVLIRQSLNSSSRVIPRLPEFSGKSLASFIPST